MLVVTQASELEAMVGEYERLLSELWSDLLFYTNNEFVMPRVRTLN